MTDVSNAHAGASSAGVSRFPAAPIENQRGHANHAAAEGNAAPAGSESPERTPTIVANGVVLVNAEGAVLLRSEGAEGFLGTPGIFEAAWKPLHATILQKQRERPAPSGEFTLDLPLGGLAASHLYVRVLGIGATGHEGYLALLSQGRSPAALQDDLLLASQMRRLNANYRHAAHDLRAPLNAIALNLELIQHSLSGEVIDSESRGKALQRVEILRREIARLSRMLQGLLAQSEQPRHTPRLLTLGRVLRESVELVSPEAERLGIRMALHLPDEPVAVVAPRDVLKQALLNLLMNALEAMPRGGPIDLELRREQDTALILIKDHGTGISRAHLERVFTLHFTTKPEGSGIGLFTTRAAIDSMGGSLTLQSREGAGTTASIQLPVAPDGAEDEDACSTS